MDEKITKEEAQLLSPKVGRPRIEGEEKILPNGLTKFQWKWIQKEARLKGIDGAQYERMIVQWYIDSIEASRASSIATEQDDHKFERLVKSKKRKRKVNQSRK